MPSTTFFNLPETKRTTIEAAAIHEFAAHGFEGAGVNAIVAGAHIAKGSFYQYFADKADLFQYVLTLVQRRKLSLASTLPPTANSRNIFSYLRWLFQLELLFELREPELARIEHFAFLQDPDNPQVMGGPEYFNDLLTQGLLHEDLAPYVDTLLAANVLGGVFHGIGRYLVPLLEDKAAAIASGSVPITEEPLAQNLLDNLMEILEAGLARNPAIRKAFYPKEAV